jgi:hypothetical protein
MLLLHLRELTEISRLQSGKNVTPVITSACPEACARSSPVAKSYTRMYLSEWEHTTYIPLGSTQTWKNKTPQVKRARNTRHQSQHTHQQNETFNFNIPKLQKKKTWLPESSSEK